ncbi:MAG TPA: hypothetical protein ENI53_02670 [Thermoplasmatales archaeon]|nr:hypothetical protein [Thermoplasmatales archaeon]
MKKEEILKIEEIINRFIDLYKKDTNIWENERFSHYDFFKLLFDFFDPQEIREKFKWEYPIGVPSYAKINRDAKVDIIFLDDSKELIAIEIELTSAGKQFENELIKCVQKLKTPPKHGEHMVKGYIIPLLKRNENKKVRGYGGKNYREVCEDAINKAENEIDDFPIKIVREGILLQN